MTYCSILEHWLGKKNLSNRTLDHEVRKISGCWKYDRINKEDESTWRQTSRVDKCTVKMCQANSDISLWWKNYRSINGDFYFNDRLQLLSWLLKAFRCHRNASALLSPMKHLNSKESVVTKERLKVIKIKFWEKNFKKSSIRF